MFGCQRRSPVGGANYAKQSSRPAGKAVAASSLIPYFAIDVLLNADVLVDDVQFWDDCRCPEKVPVVKSLAV